jgi:hypothetical protein
MARFLFLIGLLPLYAFGQLNPDHTNGLILPYWTSGELTMRDGEEVSGMIRFNLIDEPSRIQLRVDEDLFDLPVKDILQFSFYDSIAARDRTFASIYQGRKHGIVLMEYRDQTLNFGIVWHRYRKTVWREEKGLLIPYGTRYTNPDYLSRSSSAPSTSLKEGRYIYDKKSGKLAPFSFDGLMDICNSKRYTIQKYMRQRKLILESVESYMEVLNYYESLLDDE